MLHCMVLCIAPPWFRRAAPLILALLAAPAVAAGPARLEFTRLVAHWAKYADEGYLPFIEAAEPDVAQVGFYGAHFWSLSHTPHGKGYPAHFPVRGLRECGNWFGEMNRQLHRRRVKVVGHFNVSFLVGDPEGKDGPRGFFKFYRELWDEKLLGKKPVTDPLELLERKKDGAPIVNNNYRIGGMKEYWACLRNPHWQAVLKAWTRQAVRRGVDGLMINYFYRHDCHCPHCVSGFKRYLAGRFDKEQLKKKFAIDDLDGHRFEELVCWHDPDQSTPLRRQMLRWSQIANKRAFDEVFVKYGRSLKPDLIVAQWNHLGNFSQINGDERCLLPRELWGKDEDYLWYSSGGSAHYTDLKAGFLGEVTLQARYIRGAFDDKPFTIGKYENTRIRTAIAELAANGGSPMGFYTRFTDPAAKKEIVRYYQFLKRHGQLYKANRPHAEAVLLYPRSRVHEGDVKAVADFERLGKWLLDRHVLFDVLPDDLASRERLERYAHVFRPSDELRQLPDGLSLFQAPDTVRVSASRPANGSELTLHFVNYNRQEPAQPKSAGRGIADEKPISVEGVTADLNVPSNFRVAKVLAITPESPGPLELKFQLAGGRVRLKVPPFLVYAVVRIVRR